MTELINELVIAANVHSTIVIGGYLEDDYPEDEAEVAKWLSSKTDEFKIELVTQYLKNTI